ncbi:cytochrome c-type biogenesis protein [Lichenicoccus sp.]|uniref:cytochrome c-type biogenesis protein n=1 Tax=Lichenicoccus sp. TaxID=2781899 RepID=UPI003D1496F1
MIRACLLAMLLLLPPLAALAVDDPSEMLRNPAQEARAEAIGSQLRCLVCQNESIEDSSAPLARDLRHVVRVHVQQGQSNRQIIAWMVARYGNFIRLRPPLDGLTLLLWFMPGLALGLGGLAAWLGWRRRTRDPQPLSASERRRLDELLEPR